MLPHPQNSMELDHKQSKAVTVTSMSFPVGDVNNFVVGGEEGSVYTACRHGSKGGISEMFEGHQDQLLAFIVIQLLEQWTSHIFLSLHHLTGQ